MRELHQSGCFFFHKNGVNLTKFPNNVKCFRIFTDDGKLVRDVFLKKVYYFNEPNDEVLEVEFFNKEKRYFKYSIRKDCFIEVEVDFL